MSSSHNVEIKCPKCGEVRVQQGMLPKACQACRDRVYYNRRLDTMRRPGRQPYCGLCAEEARFEYYLLPPPGLQKRQRGGPQWVALCKLCFNTWLESGQHRVVSSPPELFVGAGGRTYTQDAQDAFSAEPGVGLTNEWRR